MNDKEKKYNEFYMDVAKRAAQMSYAERRKVGAVIVKNGNIISTAWNGTPSGFDNCCEDVLDDGTTKTKPSVVHSEMNSILKLAKGTESGNGATMYCTLSPCMDCAKAIQGAGIKEVFYDEVYRDASGIDFLKHCGINVTKL
jgi:dCMP deaminase